MNYWLMDKIVFCKVAMTFDHETLTSSTFSVTTVQGTVFYVLNEEIHYTLMVIRMYEKRWQWLTNNYGISSCTVHCSVQSSAALPFECDLHGPRLAHPLETHLRSHACCCSCHLTRWSQTQRCVRWADAFDWHTWGRTSGGEHNLSPLQKNTFSPHSYEFSAQCAGDALISSQM